MVFSPHPGSRTRPRDHRSRNSAPQTMFYPEERTQAEITMNRQSDRDRIAEEAVGQRHGSAPPYAEGKAGVSQEEAARQLAPSSGAQASTPEKTAESVGERVGDAYSDPQRVEQHPKSNTGRLTATGAGSHNNGESNRFLSVGRKVTENLSHPLFEERFLTVVGGFALGYLTAVLLHGRINAYFDTRPGPFQITKPPQGEQHPRGFVQSTVLKTITEHPQGMTTAEIITELRPQGIGQESIANALDVLVQAKKISSPGREGKYLPAASEVPTAPDQPSP
jgi:hypothetical protein